MKSVISQLIFNLEYVFVRLSTQSLESDILCPSILLNIDDIREFSKSKHYNFSLFCTQFFHHEPLLRKSFEFSINVL